MIRTFTKILYEDKDLLLWLNSTFKIKGNVNNPAFKQKIFNDYILKRNFKLPKTYPCLAKINIYANVYYQTTEIKEWNFKWYYYNDVIFWEQRMIEYKNTMKNKIKLSENENFIL